MTNVDESCRVNFSLPQPTGDLVGELVIDNTVPASPVDRPSTMKKLRTFLKKKRKGKALEKQEVQPQPQQVQQQPRQPQPKETSLPPPLLPFHNPPESPFTPFEPLLLDSPLPETPTQSSPSASSSSAAAAARIVRSLDNRPCPRLNIVIMIIGSRGDSQPFLKIGQVLQNVYGHRVRIATHPTFRSFVEKDAGLEFFSVGGDPTELMAYMVKNPGIVPTISTVRSGDIGRRRAAMAEMFDGFWRACIDDGGGGVGDGGVGVNDDDGGVDDDDDVDDSLPFVADAIIANPPSLAHVHCAEALGIPLHLMFTFPYTPTQAFPHPLTIVTDSELDPGITNFITYPMVDMMVWQGLGDLVNRFRVDTLGLDAVSTLWAPETTYRMRVPVTYLWSPALVPKPTEWGPEIDISGFVFLDLASSFTPPDALAQFLAASDEPPIYIGFGSVVVDDAGRFTEMIYEAVRLAGVRALVSPGWGGFGGSGQASVPKDVFLIGNTPHDWLFPQVRACVIHGGAGTTAIALKCGRPTMVVPFFGDQYFWGSMIEKAGAGPRPVPYKRLTAERLAEGIRFCLTGQAQQAAKALAASIQNDGDGAQNACRSFHNALKLRGRHSMRCSIFPDLPAVWETKKSHIKLSTLAAQALVEQGRLSSYKKLHLLRHYEWDDFKGSGEPITAALGSLTHTIRDVFSGITVEPYQAANTQWKRRQTVVSVRGLGVKRKGGNGVRVRVKGIKGRVMKGKGAKEDRFGRVKRIKGVKRTRSAKILQSDSTLLTSETNISMKELAASIGRGMGKSLGALLLSPFDLWFSLSQGFHNAPRLYGDDTVRRLPRVTGIQSGLVAAGSELFFGVFDGVTGLVWLPVRGARRGGVLGCIKGVGQGLMGFVLKDFSAIIGPVGYTMHGVTKEMTRVRRTARSIRKARMVQGQRVFAEMSMRMRGQTLRRAAEGWATLEALWAYEGRNERGERSERRDERSERRTERSEERNERSEERNERSEERKKRNQRSERRDERSEERRKRNERSEERRNERSEEKKKEKRKDGDQCRRCCCETTHSTRPWKTPSWQRWPSQPCVAANV